MKRVKLLMDPRDYNLLEEKVNKFLESIAPEKVLDIQYRDCSNAASVMIVYEDELAIAADPNPLARTFEDIYGGANFR